MDSQLTLVNPTELPDRFARTELVFDRDSLTNADLRLRGSAAVVYTIRTPGRSFSRTDLCKVEGSDSIKLASIQRNEMLPDTITFLGGGPTRTKKWIKHKTFTVSVPGIGDRTYTWKPTSLREIALYDQQNPLTPVAWYRTAYRQNVDGVEVTEMPTLSLQPEVESIAHLVLTSLLIVEQKYRMRSQGAVMRPAGYATGVFTV
ncbi:hypothetical protein C8T65DRAFT_41651 [Cerioporus squamosus]|nr:hypothetical protein C8T65DRAFT_41651 [Cerioporus squamosus]